ncbi:MAG: AAA family ATPase [Deltaproteobacteria bacterium]|nr:AAA family ATPase [Deltaproteobacteria bacterium]
MAGPTERPDDPAARDLFLPDSLAEVRTAGARLAALSAARPPEGCPQAPQACARAEALCGFPLDPGQREALAAVVGGRAALITGPRGAGKRLLAALLYRLFRERGLPACLASADGRGAEALAEAARAPARPLAALLEYSPGAGGFLRGPRNPLPAGLLAVTGAESLDAGLLSRILSAAPTGTTLALFGETGRAPPPRAACDPAETVDAGGAGLPAWLAGLAGLRRGLPGPAQPGRRRGSGAAVGLLRHVRLSAAYAPPGSQLLEALASLGRGEAPPGSPGPDGDFFYLLGEDEGALAAKVVRLMADRIPRKLGLPPGDASVALAGAGEGPLGARALSEALHGALGTPAAAPGCPTPPPLVLGGRAFRPGGRVLQSANAPELGLALGDRGTVLTAGPGALNVRVAFDGRELRLGHGDLTRLLPAWALPAASAPAWASFPAAVVTIGKGAERELDRAGLRRAASLAGRLLVIAGHPLVYGRILGSRGGGRPAPGRR